MFIALLVASVLAYGLQNVLMGGLFRRHDLATMVTARGLGLALIMAPITLFAPAAAWAQLLEAWLPLGIACLAATLANFSQAVAVRHLPMGIAYAVLMTASTLLQVGYGLVVLVERPGLPALLLGATLVGLTIALALVSRRSSQLRDARPLIGVAACLAFGGTMATALVALFHVANHSHPLLAAWGWEAGIGLVALLYFLLRRILRSQTGTAPAARVWLQAALYASPTLVGTGAYAFAVTLGPLSIAAAVLATVMVSSAIFARLIHHERLSPVQWALVVLTTCCVIALELVRERPPPDEATILIDE